MQILRASAVALLLVAAAFVTASCETSKLFAGDPEQQFPKDTQWMRGQPFTTPSFDVIWQRTGEVLAREGFRADEALTSVSHGEIVSLWITRMAPTRYQGKRRRAHVRIEPLEGAQWRAAVAVIRQQNADIDDPPNVVSAQWEADGIDEDRSKLLLWGIEQPFRK